MCGINGILHTKSTTLHDYSAQLDQMNLALAHRGPDDTGVWVEGNTYLGHRRLSIIDLSAAGHQPMLSPDGRYVLIFNGEIYNFQALRAELADYPYHSGTDSEVILAAYARWGAACVERFYGMFAFAIWDRELEELFLARDRMGVKPLYYCHKNGVLAFSSEMRGLLASGLPSTALSAASVADYLRYQTVHAPYTILEDVQMLLPGHYLYWSQGVIRTGAYWSIVPPPLVEPASPNWTGQLRQAMHQAVERRLISDVPFGAFLSGGIDSSIIVALMSQILGKGVKTFTVTFAEGAYDESPFARMVAQRYQTEHHEIRLSPKYFLELLPGALDAMDHPSGDGPNSYVISKATKDAGITMALSGIGGDELFAGYSIFQQAQSLQHRQWINAVPQFLRQLGGQALMAYRPDVASRKIAHVLAQKRVDIHSAYPIYRQVLLDDQVRELLDLPLLPPNRVAEQVAQSSADPHFAELPLLSQVSVFEFQTYLRNVLLRDTDQMSMAHALEVREPFMDRDLVALALRIPDAVKSGRYPKQLLIDAFADLLPPEIIHRPKMGFTLPFEQWMRGELKDFCAAELASLGRRPLFIAAAIDRLWDDFLQHKKSVTWSRVWTLVVLGYWLDKNGI